MARVYKSPFDDKVFKTIPELEKHVSSKYKNKIPKKYKGDVSQFLYDDINKPGVCQICKTPTKWDATKKKYKLLCEPITIKRMISDPLRVIRTLFKNRGNTCQDVMRKNYVENIERVYGTDNLMNSIEYQQKLLESRSIAKLVNFKGKEYTVIGSYEKKFVEVFSRIAISPRELEAPGPVIKYETFDNVVKEHISDFYLPSIKTVVSIKDGGDNKNTHTTMTERRRNDAYKFKGLIDSTDYNLIELNGIKEIEDFKTYYLEIKESIKRKERYIKYPEYFYDYF